MTLSSKCCDDEIYHRLTQPYCQQCGDRRHRGWDVKVLPQITPLQHGVNHRLLGAVGGEWGRMKIKAKMSDAMQTIYAGSRARLHKRQPGSKCRRSLGPRGPDIIYYLLCIIQIAIHPRLVILLASGLSHSLSYQLTQFNANGSTQ